MNKTYICSSYWAFIPSLQTLHSPDYLIEYVDVPCFWSLIGFLFRKCNFCSILYDGGGAFPFIHIQRTNCLHIIMQYIHLNCYFCFFYHSFVSVVVNKVITILRTSSSFGRTSHNNVHTEHNQIKSLFGLIFAFKCVVLCY